MRRRHPGVAHGLLGAAAGGNRLGWRIIGLHTLIAREIERVASKPTLFPNAVALGDYAVDLHGSMTVEWLEQGLDRVEDIPHKFGQRGVGPFPIPFECFIPEKVDGFLPAEKNISQSRMANGATRLQPHTLLMGQASGAIAALAVKSQCCPRDVNPVEVRLALLDAGDTLFLTPLLDVYRDTPDWKPVQLALTHGVMLLQDGKFQPKSPLTQDDLALIVAKLAGNDAPAPSSASPVTARQFADAVGDALSSAKKPLRANLEITDADKPLTRVAAAHLLVEVLRQQGGAR